MASACGKANKLLVMVCQVSKYLIILSAPVAARSDHSYSSALCCLSI
jgi:hypothetical protein